MISGSDCKTPSRSDWLHFGQHAACSSMETFYHIARMSCVIYGSMLFAKQRRIAVALAAGSVLSSVGWVSLQQRAPQSLRQTSTGVALVKCAQAISARQA